MKDTISNITMKQLEQMTFRAIQESFSQVMTNILLEFDTVIAEERDKKRFYLKGKRRLKFESVYGQVELQRNYYHDRETGKYVYLLDQYLAFDGTKGMSPVVQDLAMELAVTGTSYRQAEQALEKLLGYPVISHEGIRQQLLNTEVIRATLIEKRHYIHQETLPFWEEFELFLMDTYAYDPTKHHLVINGDGVPWITACRDYFRHNITFVIDRFHVARDIQSIFRRHPRYRKFGKSLPLTMRKASCLN